MTMTYFVEQWSFAKEQIFLETNTCGESLEIKTEANFWFSLLMEISVVLTRGVRRCQQRLEELWETVGSKCLGNDTFSFFLFRFAWSRFCWVDVVECVFASESVDYGLVSDGLVRGDMWLWFFWLFQVGFEIHDCQPSEDSIELYESCPELLADLLCSRRGFVGEAFYCSFFHF